MKKTLLALITIAALVLLAVYILIPPKIKITANAAVNAKDEAVHRILMDNVNWNKWWPYEKSFQLQQTNFKIIKKMLNAFEIMIYKNKDSVESILELIPVTNNTTQLNWTYDLITGKDPVKRFDHYRFAQSIKKDIHLVLDSLKSFLDKTENIYGMNVKQVKVTDSVLISTRKTFDHYPDEFETEEMIKTLRAYISSNNAKEMNYPMLHIQQSGNSHFEAMTAIATNIELPDTKHFAHKMLLKGGNLLEAEITGGHATIRAAFDKYPDYLEDNQYTSPAIPYQLIITDRTKERDTSKWITKICYPVF